MSTLELSPPLLLLVMGLPGSGKTFFARQFAEQYKLPYISEDRIRYELFESPQFSDSETEIIGRIRDWSMEQLYLSNKTMVVDGLLLKAKQRKELIKTAEKNSFRVITVWVQTDLNTSEDRSSKRDRRNVDSKYSFSIDQSVFDDAKKQLERPGEKETSVVISGKHAYKSQALTVIRKITNVYSESLSKVLDTMPPRQVLRSSRKDPLLSRRVIQ